MKHKVVKDGFVIGAALFSMFFGAGNMIFPPYLGMQAGPLWLLSFVCYYISDIGLAMAVIAALLKHGSFEKILSLAGKRAATVIMFAVVLCLGPIICIPRTAATTFELSVMSVMPNANIGLCYVVFFTLVFLLCKNESSVVDTIGNVLTPVLFVGLIYLIAAGVVNQIGDIASDIKCGNVAVEGIQAGYQSLDALAAAVFGVLIINSALHKGYKSTNQLGRVVGISCIVAGIGLLVVYLGLTYLGATVSGIYDNHTYRSELLMGIVDRLLPGHAGVVVFAVIAGLACLSTAVAITGACANYFCNLTRGRVSYTMFVAIVCAFSFAVAFVGVDRLVSVASPVLNVLYPPVIVIVFVSFFVKNNR